MGSFSRWVLRAWYSPSPVWFFIPLAWAFWVISGLRRWAYVAGLLRVAKLPVPVIVVGNITVGGTGKTPFVIWLAQQLKRRGLRPGIVTRGHGGNSRIARAVAADSDPKEVGDEALLLARHSGVPVAAGRDRLGAANLLLQAHSLDVLLSDDGLQHYRLPRCHEIVLLDGGRGLGNGWLLPAGPLRETDSRLNEVSQVIIKQVPGGVFSWPEALRMRLKAETAVPLTGGERRPLSAFHGEKVHAVAGIGNPQQFFATLAAAGLNVDGHPLADHAWPAPSDLTFDDSRPVFMTEKDAVKCRHMELPHHWYVEAAVEFDAADAAGILTAVQRAMQTVN